MHADLRPPNRMPPTLAQRINPLWWAGDAERPSGWTWWQHFLRNPFANFTMTVIGCAHRERAVVYSASPWTYADDGWNSGWVIPSGGMPRPFMSWRGRRWEWCIGWKTNGGATIQFRRANSPNQTETP